MSLVAICTISTSSHLFKVQALFDGLTALTAANMHCLVTTDVVPKTNSHITYHVLDELKGPSSQVIQTKYQDNELRWACKPLFLKYLLDSGYDRVIYVDNDIFFYASPDFLFEQLKSDNILLTPHFYPADPKEEQFWLEANFRVGLYNAGFIGVSKNAISALEWWASCCAYNVKQSGWRGLFDDQKYLDLFPILFENVHILKHAGCNVAGWNKKLSARSVDTNGALLLNERWPLVFIHFNVFTFRAIERGWDPLLLPHLRTYLDYLHRFNPNYSFKQELQLTLSDYSRYLRHLLWKLARLTD